MSIYDIIAKIAEFIHNSNNEYEIVSDYICSNKENIRKEFDDLVTNNHSNVALFLKKSKVLKYYLSEDCSFMVQSINELIDNNKYLLLIMFLSMIDDILDEEILTTFNETDDNIFEPFYSKRNIMILPQYPRCNCWKYSPNELSSNLNAIFNNILIVYISGLFGYNIVNHFITNEYYGNDFIVAGSPISKNIELKIEKKIINNVNKISYNVSCSEDFVDRLLKLIKKSDEKRTSIISFPELVSNKELNAKIIESLQSINLKNLKLIALPTYYDPDTNQNIGNIYSVDLKKVIIPQEKLFPFIKYKKNDNDETYKELLNNSNTVHILHIRGVGRIIFPICKDMLVSNYINLCRALNVNLVIARSFSPSTFGYRYFARIIRGYMAFDCFGFWINSCCYSANENEKKAICIKANSKCEEFTFNEKQNDRNIIYCNSSCSECLYYLTAN